MLYTITPPSLSLFGQWHLLKRLHTDQLVPLSVLHQKAKKPKRFVELYKWVGVLVYTQEGLKLYDFEVCRNSHFSMDHTTLD